MDLSINAQKIVFETIYTEEENLLLLSEEKLEEIKRVYLNEENKMSSFKNSTYYSFIIFILMVINILIGYMFMEFSMTEIKRSQIRESFIEKNFTLMVVLSCLITVITSLYTLYLYSTNMDLRNLYLLNTKGFKFSTDTSNSEDRYKNLISNPAEQFKKDLFINTINTIISANVEMLQNPHVVTFQHLRYSYLKLEQQNNFKMLNDHEKIQVIILKTFKDNI